MTELIKDKSDKFVKSSEDELVDITREYINYVREDSIWDQLNKNGRLTIICLVLLANFLVMLLSAFGGLV